MDINDNFRDIIVKEINYSARKMTESSSSEEKLFYFSGIYSVIQRIFNLEYDSDLVYTFLVLQQTYSALHQRLQAIQKGGETLIPLEEYHFEKLTKIAEELGKKIAKKEDLNNTLKKLFLLSYTTTGNGFYLFQKGLLKI